MMSNTRTTQVALKNLITSKLPSLKICFRKSFHNKFADQWTKEEVKINALIQELKTGLNQGDTIRIQEAVNDWKNYLMIDASWKSERISELRLKSFLNSSDGRFYGGAMNDFMMLLQKIEGSNSAKHPESSASGNSGTLTSKEKHSTNNQNNTNKMLTIEHPLTGVKIQVANQDFINELFWEDAKKACQNLGNGWRLPTIEELQAMYEQLHVKGLGKFNNGSYWSSTGKFPWDALLLSFEYNNIGTNGEDCEFHVRAVRNV